MNLSLKTLAALIAGACVMLAAACGGGGNPQPITVGGTLNGQLVQEGVVKVASADGDGLSGIDVTLISKGNGAVVARGTTDAGGRFQFQELPNGGYLLHLRFNESVDLDLDGVLEEIDLFFPIDIADDAVTELLQRLEAADTDGDGVPDSINVNIRIMDDKGKNENAHQQHRRRHGELREDDDNDGSFEDGEGRFDDDDGDGLPDDGSWHGPRGPKLRGDIEAISDDSITVDGQTFIITDATSFKIRGNPDSDPAKFEVGDEVQVTSFTNDAGDQVAIEIKLKINNGQGGDGDNDNETEVAGAIEALSDTSITVDGQDFTISANTLLLFNDLSEAELSDFAIGDIVEVEAKLVGNDWVALKIKHEDEDEPIDEVEVSGDIEALSATSIAVDGQTFTLDGATTFEFTDGSAALLADFEVGSPVTLVADLESGVWVVRTLKFTEDPPTGPGDFSLSFTEMTPHLGQNLYLKLKDPVSGHTIATAPVTAITMADFTISIPDITAEGTNYNVDFWADVDANGSLDGTPIADPPGVDHAWRLTGTADADGLALDFVHDTNFTDIRPFDDPVVLGDFTINFTDMTPHIGQYLYLKVKDSTSTTTIAEAPLTLITAAAFSINLPAILTEGTAYNIDFWADVDGNATLDGNPNTDPPGVDHAWRLSGTADADGLTFNYMHDTNFTDIRPY